MLYIRVDANKKLGVGHMMRCLAIAKEGVRQGLECTFIVSDEESRQIADKFGFNIICLNSKWNDLNKEIDILLQVIVQNKIKLLLIDSYYITNKYIEIVGNNTNLIYLGDLRHYAKNITCLINYNNYYNKFNYNDMFRDGKTKLLLGTKYTPLRREFNGIKSSPRNTISNVLITTGGTDIYNIAGKLAKYFIDKKNEKDICFNIVVGSLNENLDFLSCFEKKNKNVKLHINTKNMATLMIESDIAISAGGSTLYELSSCGIPTICYAFVDNQLDSVNEFANSETMISVGDIRDREDECIDLIYEKLQFLKDNYNIRKKMSSIMQDLVDGKGAYRIIKEIDRLISKS
ncbi:UDP-2,4-diacetamido-2,4,6-trideoxy-beta-L-altropyranose hydrolase [Clostridium tetani]|uniref:UDP-2,4-diacetamido-2,4, 6-trideoxy-beta-L-altropyranose hydrolase n=1 Tax=Clostridium tetani TaxID=1513 RepID=UPI0029534C79|nr:UDP-2,4-diacetamido-2,4,6-trideoxy-beta-L-altropyranose hydrolase [Clostridium tetani]BDR75921.1 hypothetical protein K154306013_15810 [Clostridium tetani]